MAFDLEKEYELDMEDLSSADFEDLEEVLDLSIDEILGRMSGEIPKPKLKIMRALFFINERKKNPSLTMEETKGVKFAAPDDLSEDLSDDPKDTSSDSDESLT